MAVPGPLTWQSVRQSESMPHTWIHVLHDATFLFDPAIWSFLIFVMVTAMVLAHTAPDTHAHAHTLARGHTAGYGGCDTGIEREVLD